LFSILVKDVIPKENEQIKSVQEESKEVDFIFNKLFMLLKKIASVSYLNKWIAQGIINKQTNKQIKK